MADTTTRVYRSLSGSEIHAVFGNIKFGDIQMIKYAISRQKVPVYTMGSADLRAIARGVRSINGALVFSHLSTGGLVAEMKKAGSKVFLSHDELANYNAEYQQTGNMTQTQRLALQASGSVGFVGTVTAGNNQNLNQGSTLNPLQSNGTNNFNPFAVGTAVNNLSNYGRLSEAWLADQLPPFDITLIGVPETAGNELSGANNSTFKPQSLVLRGVEFVSEASGTSIEDLVIEKQMAFLARSIKDWQSVDL